MIQLRTKQKIIKETSKYQNGLSCVNYFLIILTILEYNMLLCALVQDDDAIISKDITKSKVETINPRQQLRSPTPARACKKSKLVTSPFVANYGPSKIAKHKKQPSEKTKIVENQTKDTHPSVDAKEKELPDPMDEIYIRNDFFIFLLFSISLVYTEI